MSYKKIEGKLLFLNPYLVYILLKMEKFSTGVNLGSVKLIQ